MTLSDYGRPPAARLIDKSFKGRFPFRLATTSFIYPESWVPNVEKLGPFFDEIELLVLEGDPASWPTRREIRELSQLAAAHNLTYNIHLPLDIFLGHRDRSMGERAVDVVLGCLERVARLPVSVHVLHAVLDVDPSDPAERQHWIERTHASLARLTARGVAGEKLALETLDYPLTWLSSAIDDLNLSVCLDLGHLWLNGFCPLDLYSSFQDRTAILHVHGIQDGRDHVALNHLCPCQQTAALKQILRRFAGVVSLEVFSFSHLAPSLVYLETIWQDCILGQNDL